MKHITYRLVIILGILLSSFSVSAQIINLKKDEWQLISFTKVPKDNGIEDIFGAIPEGETTNGVEIWGFDNAPEDPSRPEDKKWRSWPPRPGVSTSNLTFIEPGLGYWIKSNSDDELLIDLTAAEITTGSIILYPGWNLVGLSVDENTAYTLALSGISFLELWTYEPDRNAFLAVQKAPDTNIILKEEFNTVKPGQGYWVYITEQQTLLPELGTLLPSDIDVEPLLQLREYGKPELWENYELDADVDWNGNGYFDFPDTQTVVGFGDFLNRQRIEIINKGNGILTWEATVDSDRDWLRFEAVNDDGEAVLTNAVNGMVAGENGELVLVVNRQGLAPNQTYEANIILRANGKVKELEEPIKVTLEVADIVGDYEVTVRLDNVNNKIADLHNPKYFISLARDGVGMKAFLDEERSLLITDTTYLNGNFIENPQANFQLTGQLNLDVYSSNGISPNANNPYGKRISREFTLIGQRSDGYDGLSPLDLKGEYAETIYGIFETPVMLTGEFIARRLSPEPKKTDKTPDNEPQFGNINAASDKDNPGTSYFYYNVTDRLSITDIKARLQIQHAIPEALTIKLYGPANPVPIELHSEQDRSLRAVNFDESDEPVESLDYFDGQIAFGEWMLEITNTSSSVGQLEAWTLDIRGANVYQIAGVTSVPGLNLELSGCGIVQSVTSSVEAVDDKPAGSFVFDGLIPCDYSISVVQFGYDDISTDVIINGCRKDSYHACDTLADYVVGGLEIDAQVLANSGRLNVRVSPKSQSIPAMPIEDKPLQITAVDTTDYSALGWPQPNRTWELYKTVTGWSQITPDGQLVGVQGTDQEMPSTNNYISHSEDPTQWAESLANREKTNSRLDPRGLNGAIKVTADDSLAPQLIHSSDYTLDDSDDGSFIVSEGRIVSCSAFFSPGSTSEARISFWSGSTLLAAETLDFTTGANTGDTDLTSAVQTLAATGWYRASVNFTADVTYSDFYCNFEMAKSGAVTGLNKDTLYVFGLQAEIHDNVSLLIPIMVGDIVIFIPQTLETNYIATAGQHRVSSKGQLVDTLIARKTDGEEIWTYTFDESQNDLDGAYYVKMQSDVGLTYTPSYLTDYVTLYYRQTSMLHMASVSVYAASGQSVGAKPSRDVMDTATFDIDRPPMMSAAEWENTPPAGLEDSDSFKVVLDTVLLTGTNKANESTSDNMGFHRSGMDKPQGDPEKHYRMYVSAGQLYHTAPIYTQAEDVDTGGIRMDVGIQTVGLESEPSQVQHLLISENDLNAELTPVSNGVSITGEESFIASTPEGSVKLSDVEQAVYFSIHHDAPVDLSVIILLADHYNLLEISNAVGLITNYSVSGSFSQEFTVYNSQNYSRSRDDIIFSAPQDITDKILALSVKKEDNGFITLSLYTSENPDFPPTFTNTIDPSVSGIDIDALTRLVVVADASSGVEAPSIIQYSNPPIQYNNVEMLSQ